jgi:TRAP-type C4-dicarboxylate transport system permease large subunit
MILFIIAGATVYGHFLSLTHLPTELATWVLGLDLHPKVVMLIVLGIYLVGGCFMDSLALLLLTLPIFYPVSQQLGFDPIWFGVLIVVVVEIGLISPPVGMNLFVLNSLLPQVPTQTIFRGVLPFMVADVVRLALLIAFPVISLYLPSLMR